MAKARTFADKFKKVGKDESRQVVKIVTPEKLESGGWKFRTRVVVVTDENKKEIFG
ncbi:MAG TPA: hypothetical protein VGB22_04405 [candidate division Zixibacteria bacterium]|jgi:hypothetical protein